MFAFILRRLLQAVAVMLTVALLAFVLFQYVGDPVTIMLGQDATDAERIELRERLGLNEPAVVQFGHFVANAAQGNFGISLRQSEPVSTLLKSRLPATLELSLVAAVLALVVGVPLACIPRSSATACCRSCCWPDRCWACRCPPSSSASC